jgi:D-alanyl-D-alanine carboxypeptidase/D-alanyl-D-alanine-endopeptidase (penicillin-binding protein 4)
MAAIVLAGFGALLPPAPAAAQEEVTELRAQLQGLLDSYRGDVRWGVMIVSLDQGDTLYSMHADSALAPASNLKLLTTAAALEILGPEYRFRTYLLTTGEIVDGVLEGDLVLYGTGDPGISDRFYPSRDEVFHRLIDQLADQGVHTVRGDLVADASFFPGPLRPVGWDPSDLNDHFTAAVSALSFNENVLSFRIVPASAVGQAPSVFTIPAAMGMDVVNTARTVVGRARPRVSILRNDPLAPVSVVGEIVRTSSDVWRQITVSRPAIFTAENFRAVLDERGIAVNGDIRLVSLPVHSAVRRIAAPAAGKPGARILARHVSPPLREYVEVINKHSHNLFAELTFRALGRVAGGVGTPAVSAQAVRSVIERFGIDTDGLVQLDGSGLSGANRVSARTFVELIGAMAERPLWPEYWASLPEAGRPRELGRMYRTAAAGNLRAKTGTIDGVSALTGLVRSANGERLAFSMLLNGARSTSRAKAIENRVGARLASFTRSVEGLPARFAGSALPELRDEGTPGRHVVASGENLTVIAREYGLTVEDLLGANPRLDANRIMAGQSLMIPEVPTQIAGSGG